VHTCSPECICCRAVALLDARSIGKVAQLVKQKRLKTINRGKKEFSSSEPMNQTHVSNLESKASAYLGANTAIEEGRSYSANRSMLCPGFDFRVL